MKVAATTLLLSCIVSSTTAFTAFHKSASNKSSTKLAFEAEAASDAVPEEDQVVVRFINYNTQGETAAARVKKGMNLLNLADSPEIGVHIPRNCRSGLCGSCTADMIDPTWQEGNRPGFQTIRLCSSGAVTPEGCKEMTIDCWRSISNSPEMDENGLPIESSPVAQPMDRFGDDWEKEFTPDFKSGGSGLSAQVVNQSKMVKTGETTRLPRATRDTSDWNCRDITRRVGRVKFGETEGVASWLITEPNNFGI
mmetsp:Transcript_25195/g.38978  ORF Transcript_25195/g.38978 Transcript_25195/m.38978 type:complete len:252 (-) Transcript_25195:121-876(-)|eukprot:CAMPEP_0196808754 /NCGR_PEP_ID=MMETSP1362-20130617/8746_1 /TAXON_ID=163516 /ORGANISM="Leptocylindrus danicus, Strain CCMP1856" /LENGTH=251 /DNA_ID=CAMNT_0042183207 /DNA_START=127 /DNA_END=882 /DNA_ORIENTATION=+